MKGDSFKLIITVHVNCFVSFLRRVLGHVGFSIVYACLFRVHIQMEEGKSNQSGRFFVGHGQTCVAM